MVVIETIVIIVLAVFFLYVLFNVFFWLFAVALNIFLIVLAGYHIKENFLDQKYTFLLCGFLGLFGSLYLSSTWFLWKITAILVFAASASFLIALVADRFD